MINGQVQKVLVATDGSPRSMEAAEFAAALLRGSRTTVLLVHVVPTTSIPEATTQLVPEDKVEIEKTMWEGAQAILDRARVPFDLAGTPVEGVVRRGEAAEQIVDLTAEERPDLVVLGTRGESDEVEGLGSTSRAVLSQLVCPILLVP